MKILLLACAVACVAQDDPAALVEQLRSERSDARRDARRKLKDLGPAAQPALEKATKDGDAEVAAAAKELLQILAVSQKLTRSLRQALPGVEERLAAAREPLWTETFLEAVRDHPALQREDLEPLASAALKGAEGKPQKHDVMARVAERRMTSAAPALAAMLKDDDADVREMAAFFLGYLGSKVTVPDLRRELNSTSFGVARRASAALGQLRAAEATPDLVKFLEDSASDMRKASLKSLVKIGAKEAAPSILKLLRDPAADVRVAAAAGLCDFGRTEGVETILKDGDHPQLNWEEAPALTFLNALRRPEEWRKLADNSLEWTLAGAWGLEDARGKILERIAAKAGLKLEVLAPADWTGDVQQVQKWCGPTTLVQDLLLMLSSSGYDVVVESDRLRILAHAEALKFWQTWWKEQQGRK